MRATISWNGRIHRSWRISFLAIWILGASCAPSEPVVKIASSAGKVDEVVLATVSVESIANLIAFEAHLSFDPNLLEVTELKNGNLVQADFVVQNTFDNTAGTIDYAVAQIEHPPANGSGTLFEIVFRAKASGQAAIHFRATQAAPAGMLLSDPKGVAIPVSLQEGNVTVQE